MKKILAIFISASIVLMLSAFLTGCGGNGLSGKYESESGTYSVEFKKSGECTWYQGGKFFEGTYSKNDNGYKLEIKGGGFYSNTVFEAEKDGKDLIITGGVVKGERFVKK